MIQVKRFQKWVILMGVSLALSAGFTSYANEPYYLNGDKTLPMIQNTGGTYGDGATGIYMDLSTIEVEDVFEDGLQAKVKLVNVESANTCTEDWIHVRYSVDGKAWALGKDSRWREIPSNTDDPASLVVSFIRQEMGASERRDTLSGEISAIMDKKQDNPGKVTPDDAIPLIDVQAPQQDVKKKGAVQKADKEKDNSEPVTVTITEAPQVEITSNPPVQVDIT
jgi:hypothetical protein